ncbi:hypothetical protein BGZ46_010919, partial [Entomortierella lignicola]
MPAIAETTCYNLSKFRATMKSFRVLDDNIMLRLNETNTHDEPACANFFNELVAAYQKRDASIKYCIETMDKNIAAKKQKLYEDPDDYTLKDSIMTDESKRQIIANENVIEDIVRGRSLKAFQEKCALFDLPENIQEFLDKRHDYAPAHLDPSIFESVGNGVAPTSFDIPDLVSSPTPSSPEPLKNLKALADGLNPLGLDNPQPSLASARTKSDDIGSSQKRRLDAVDELIVGWDLELDQRVNRIDNLNIFDKLFDPDTNCDLVPNEFPSIPPTLEASSRDSALDDQLTLHLDSDNSRQKKNFLHNDHSEETSTPFKDSVEFSLELPPLTKRPRDIVDDCFGNDGFGLEKFQPDQRNAKVLKTHSAGASKKNTRMSPTDTWRAAGIPQKQDTVTGKDGTGANTVSATPNNRPDKMQLSWETCTEFGPKIQLELPFVSPYITEAGTRMFEAVYQKHVDYSFKFQESIAVIPYKSLIDCTLLLLNGTSSSIFSYNQDAMEFEMNLEKSRIEGCSASSVLSLLQDMMNIGSHMRRLVNVAETCIHHPDGMGMIRIAFGRSLSSYLTFLQGTVVALQEKAHEGNMHILELHHKTHDMGVILERLAHLCQCHVMQSLNGFVARHGFYLPLGTDLLSMIYNEINEQPSVSDPLWTALLTSILDHASKPYRDILSRWLGITPSAYSGHDRNQLSQIASARRPSPESDNKYATRVLDGRSSLISIFDCHLQQSLQGLDPFEELFVRSMHGWSWDGAEPIILADPLDYDAEFQWNENSPPPSFIDVRLAEQVLEAGKELQILVEFEPRHPLIAHDRKPGQTGTGLKWLYVHSDIAKHKRNCDRSSSEILQALAMRLESMGWISKHKASNERKRRQWRKQKLKGRQNYISSFTEDSLDNTFGGSTSQMNIDTELASITEFDSEVFGLAPRMDSDLQGFFSLSSTIGKTRDMSLACPDMMAFLLRPCTSPSNVIVGNLSLETPVLPPNSQYQADPSNKPHRTRLGDMAPLAILADQSFGYSIRTRISLISTCVMSLYFHDLNLLGHLEIMERFLLMRDGRFVARMEEALFEDETGLLTQTARAVLAEATDSGSNVSTGRLINMPAPYSWRTRLTWPPRSGELELTLRAVLLECFQPSDSQDLSDDDGESDLEYMDVEENESIQRIRKENVWKKKGLDANELENILAFAVKKYDDDSKIPKDANALEALDFLYLDYKAPRPLRLLFFTPEAYDKYTRLFTFQLRLARIDATLKRIYMQLRTRQKLFQQLSTEGTVSDNNRHREGRKRQQRQQQQQLKLKKWQIEMMKLHQFRFETQQIFDGFRGYIIDVAMGSTWNTFIERLKDVQARIEGRIMNNHLGPDDINLEADPRSYADESMQADTDHSSKEERKEEEEEEEEEDEHMTSDGLRDLSALHEYHEYILDRMLFQSLLKRKQAPILKVVNGILNCILKLSQLVDRLPEPKDYRELQSSEDQERDQGQDEEAEARMMKLKSLQDKFRSLCHMLVKVLKVLDERGLGMEGSISSIASGTSTSAHKIHDSSKASNVKFLQQLLLRIDLQG